MRQNKKNISSETKKVSLLDKNGQPFNDNAFVVFSSTYNTSQVLQNPYLTEAFLNKWVDYGYYGDTTVQNPNSYPDYAFSLYNRSTTHAKLIDIKSDMTYGGGWENISQDILSNFHGIESMNRILNNNCWDVQFLGAFAIEIHWDDRSTIDPTYAKPSYIKYIPIGNVRVGNPFDDLYKDKVYLCENWAGRLRGNQGVKVFEYHKYSNNFEDIKNHPVQILYAPSSIKGNLHYARPLYGWQSDIFEIDYEIGKFHLTGLKEGSFATLHIHNSNGVPDADTQHSEIIDYNQRYLGTQGKRVYHTYSNGEDNKVTFNTIDLGVSDAKFIELWKENTKKIFIAHGVDSELLIGKEGMTIGREDMLEIFEKTQVKNINKIQEFIEEKYNDIYSRSGLNLDFKIKKYEINIRKVKTSTDDIIKILTAQIPDETKLQLLNDSGIQNPELLINNKRNPIADAINGLSPLVANRVLDSLSADEIRGLAGLLPNIDINQSVNKDVNNKEQLNDRAPVNNILTGLTGKQNQNYQRILRDFAKGKSDKENSIFMLTTGYGLTRDEASLVLDNYQAHYNNQSNDNIENNNTDVTT